MPSDLNIPRARILIADDNSEMVEYLNLLLHHDYDVVAAQDGEEALQLAGIYPLDLVISDVMMPRADGFELLSRLRAQPSYRDIPFILLSAQGGELSHAEGLEAGADDFIDKPFSSREFMARVRVQLKRSAERRAQISIAAEDQHAYADLQQFAFLIRHDLQEPLRNVSIFSELLEHHFGPTLAGDAAVYLNQIRKGSIRISDLLHDLMAYTTLGLRAELRPEKVDAQIVYEKSIAALSEAIRTSGAVVSSVALPCINLHPGDLELLFINLIDNAIKYRGELLPEIRVEAVPQGPNWLFSVSDNGMGISPQYRDIVFGVFKRLHNSDEYKGTGIGLAICRRVVNGYGQKIWFDSAPGEGSTFYFTIRGEVG